MFREEPAAFCFFPECVAKGSRFTLWGPGGWGVFAGRPLSNARNRTQESVWAKVRCASRKFHRRRHFWTYYVSSTFVSRGRAWHFVTCGRVWQRVENRFFVAGAILLQRFHNMRDIFRGRRSTLDVSDSIFRGRRSTSDVSCRVFFANRIGTAVRNGKPRANSVAGVEFRDTCQNWRKSRTKCLFWGLHVCPGVSLDAQ